MVVIIIAEISKKLIQKVSKSQKLALWKDHQNQHSPSWNKQEEREKTQITNINTKKISYHQKSYTQKWY